MLSWIDAIVDLSIDDVSPGHSFCGEMDTDLTSV